MAADCCTLICELCCATFAKNSNLKRHIRTVHFPERKFICEHCSKSYNTKYSLMRHITSNHSDNSKKKPIFYWQCPICIFESEKESMIEHYRLVHSLDTTTTNIKFDSFDEFQSWKQKVESESCSKYIRYRNKKYSDKVRYFYRCHRDGFYKGRGNNIRRLKQIGSNKINAHCPAKIDVMLNENTGTVSIKYMKTHVGHKLESSRLSLTFIDRAFLTKKPIEEKSGNYNSDNEKIEVNMMQVKVEENCLDIKLEETKEIVNNIEVIKTALLEKFKLILTKVENLEQCGTLNKRLCSIENSLQKKTEKALPDK